jgi:hypothetical protein
MTNRHRTLAALAVAALLLLACIGLMVAFSHSRPPQATSTQPGPVREQIRAPRDVQGVPCSRYVELDADGRLQSSILEREHAFGTVLLPANTEFALREDGTVKDVALGRDTVYDGHACLGRGPGEWMTGFHPNGRLAYCFFVADETIDGVPCRHASFWGEITGGVIVYFHDNGRLKTCRLAADATISGRTFATGTRIALDPEGKAAPAPTSPK